MSRTICPSPTLQILHMPVVLLIQTLHILEDGHFTVPHWGGSVIDGCTKYNDPVISRAGFVWVDKSCRSSQQKETLGLDEIPSLYPVEIHPR
jgi:hypothetical protein